MKGKLNMSESFLPLALLIYDECVEWIVDYVEDEIDFQTALNAFEQTKSKLNETHLDLEDLLYDEQSLTLQKINKLLEQRVNTLYDQTIEGSLSESQLKKQLIQLLDELEN